MGLLYLALLGLLAGSIAKMLMPGRDPGGWIMTIILGIGGSYLGSYVSSFLPILGDSEFGDWGLKGIISAVIGAMLLLVIYRFIAKRK